MGVSVVRIDNEMGVYAQVDQGSHFPRYLSLPLFLSYPLGGKRLTS